MQKARWFIFILIIVGAFLVGGKRLKPLWYRMTHEPEVGIMVVLLVGVLAFGVVRVLRS